MIHFMYTVINKNRSYGVYKVDQWLLMMFEYTYKESNNEFPFYYTISDGVILIFPPCIIEYLTYKMEVWDDLIGFDISAFEEELNDVMKEIRAFGSHAVVPPND